MDEKKRCEYMHWSSKSGKLVPCGKSARGTFHSLCATHRAFVDDCEVYQPGIRRAKGKHPADLTGSDWTHRAWKAYGGLRIPKDWTTGMPLGIPSSAGPMPKASAMYCRPWSR